MPPQVLPSSGRLTQHDRLTHCMSGEPHNLNPRDLGYWRSRRTHKIARATLGDPRRATSWVWISAGADEVIE
jgi:hypothetical protein